MKKFLLGIFFLTSLASAKNVDIQTIQNLPIIQQSKLEILKVQELDNIYHVRGRLEAVPGQTGGQLAEFFITKNFKQLIQGKGYHTENRSPVAFPVNVSDLKGKEAINYGTGKEVIYVFTDPECPYCKQFEKELPRLKDRYTFKIFLFPLPFHKNAVPMSKYILAGGTDEVKFSRLLEIANGSMDFQNFTMSQKESGEYQAKIDEQIELAKGAEINATPSTLDAEGGFVNWVELK